MEQEYNWKTILFGAIPVSLIMVFIFMSDISRNSKWFYLMIGMAVASGITYYFDKKKQNMFTSPFIVLIVALIVYGIKSLGLF